jgi:hypothetical protein
MDGLDKGFALGVEVLLPRQEDGTLILLSVKWDGEAEGCQPLVTVHKLLASDLPRTDFQVSQICLQNSSPRS